MPDRLMCWKIYKLSEREHAEKAVKLVASGIRGSSMPMA